MNNKELIISLIQQDLKHSQLVIGLDKLGLGASDRHCLQLLDIIAKLMNVPEGNVEIDWGKRYISLMSASVNFDIQSNSDDFLSYAEDCLVELSKVLNSSSNN